MLDIDNEGKLFLNYGEAPPSKMAGKPQPLPEAPNPILQARQPSIEDKNDWMLAYQDDQAFDKLYDDRLEILTIAARAIRDGGKSYKRALQKIIEICRNVE